MPRQHRLRPIIEVAKAALTTLFLPRGLGGIAPLLRDCRRATVGATNPLRPTQRADGFIALDIIQQILKGDHRREPSVAVVHNPSSIAPVLRWNVPSSTIWNPC